MRASAQSTSSPFIQIFSVSRIQPPPVSGRMVRGLLDDVHRTRAREAKQLGRSEGRHVPLRAGTDPQDGVRKEHRLDDYSLDTGKRERADGAGVEAGRLAHPVAPGHATEGDTGGAGDLRRVGAAVTRYEHHNLPVVAGKDERLDDLA